MLNITKKKRKSFFDRRMISDEFGWVGGLDEHANTNRLIKIYDLRNIWKQYWLNLKTIQMLVFTFYFIST